MKLIETEKILDEKYSRVFKHEEYLKLPYNFPLLVEFGKIPPDSYSTPLIYCDDNNKWHFISQKINYNKDPYKIKARIPEDLDNDAFIAVPLDSVNKHIPNLRSINYCNSFPSCKSCLFFLFIISLFFRI